MSDDLKRMEALLLEARTAGVTTNGALSAFLYDNGVRAFLPPEAHWMPQGPPEDRRTVKKRVGVCPRCSCGVDAEVDILVTTGQAYWSESMGSPNVPLTVERLSSRINHECEKEQEDG